MAPTRVATTAMAIKIFPKTLFINPPGRDYKAGGEGCRAIKVTKWLQICCKSDFVLIMICTAAVANEDAITESFRWGALCMI